MGGSVFPSIWELEHSFNVLPKDTRHIDCRGWGSNSPQKRPPRLTPDPQPLSLTARASLSYPTSDWLILLSFYVYLVHTPWFLAQPSIRWLILELADKSPQSDQESIFNQQSSIPIFKSATTTTSQIIGHVVRDKHRQYKEAEIKHFVACLFIEETIHGEHVTQPIVTSPVFQSKSLHELFVFVRHLFWYSPVVLHVI